MTFQTLETPNLILTGLTPTDMAFIFENHSKEEIMKFLGHRSEEEYELEAYKNKNGYASYNRTFLLFLLTDKTSNEIIGRCGIHNWNKDHRRAEIGYHLAGDQFKRKGFMSEALEAIIEFGFNTLNLNRIEALVSPFNVPSLRLLEKNGFLKEGALKQHYYVAIDPLADKYSASNISENGFVDSLIFGLLKEDYLKKK